MKEYHFYESHLGTGIYFSSEYDESCEETCAMCGDHDEYIGKATTLEELFAIFTDEGNWMAYSKDYLTEKWNEAIK